MIIHEKTVVFEWDATEVEHREKGNDWYWGLGVAVLVGVILSIIGGNYLLAVLLGLGGIMLGLYGNDRPHAVHIEISERGVSLNKNLYLFKAMKSFWIFRDRRGRDRLILVTGRPVMPTHILTFGEGIDPVTVRLFLLKHLEEKETKESFVDLLAEMIGM
ncbi:MAG: protein of unknown function with transrane region [Patescibacteria group bacterium]|nr:protein of unknown function with transrane region [Patescibacteria group bacterium]